MDTTCPGFYVVARVIGAPNSFKRVCHIFPNLLAPYLLPFDMDHNAELLTNSQPQWTELLVPLCGVSATEPQGNTYYWAQDASGNFPNTIWGLEGYSHAVGFFTGHPSSDVFKREMATVDRESLLAEDYDLKHYDFANGWLSREDDKEKDAVDSFVAVHHFWAKERGLREALIGWLGHLAAKTREGPPGGVQSCAVLRECNDMRLATLWVR
jgi:hypothetical protein